MRRTAVGIALLAGTFSANINVLVSDAEADLDTTVLGARRTLLALGDYDSTSDEPSTLDDGTPVHVLGGTFTDPGSGFDLRNLQVFTVVDGAAVVVTGTALADTWAQYATTMDTSLRTLTVTG